MNLSRNPNRGVAAILFVIGGLINPMGAPLVVTMLIWAIAFLLLWEGSE